MTCKLFTRCVLTVGILVTSMSYAQESQDIISQIEQEANNNSQLENLAHHLLDVIGPRLTGTPQMEQASDWVMKTYEKWGIEAKREQWGEWKGWERGITHIDMVSPRVQSLEGIQLAWSPTTPPEGVVGEVVTLPVVKDSIHFQKWLKTVKGKFVLTSMYQLTGRPDSSWEKFAKPESFEKLKNSRDSITRAWYRNIARTGYKSSDIVRLLENAGAVGIISSYWSKGFGVNRIFGSKTKGIPTLDVELEDYTMLYRLAESGEKPEVRVVARSKDLGLVPAFNTIGMIKGSEKPEEYVILSAHLDSWDGATGATDNGTGTVLMMEVMRILKKVYPNPKRTILVGHWGSEEQGLNGSRAFVEDHPEIVEYVQVVLNQDNGTGRITDISGAGFLNSYEYLSRWLAAVPEEISQQVKTTFPGSPSSGGSDNASFVAAGVPAFYLGALNWDYRDYTWHTNRDTFDKIVFDDLRSNVILTAILAYMASEDPETASREKIVMPMDPKTGEQQLWPEQKSPKRLGGVD
ncbi:M20/M25/M40 family metallo-hydrolase [Mangrovimonas xylaniphaga]|uniref:M20/M25/M40 family metallo-hydrolase n=1 Tax=Mangrovimonas xylaniphaga TaxID=1645915 RepID=UPI0006B4BAED|nr:M20/M25/M40 family metallo-hydrolase [Mangrovimonas xylaniphaga]